MTIALKMPWYQDIEITRNLRRRERGEREIAAGSRSDSSLKFRTTFDALKQLNGTPEKLPKDGKTATERFSSKFGRSRMPVGAFL
jgi:hypothetical protein